MVFSKIRFFVIVIIFCTSLLHASSSDNNDNNMTHAQQLWGRKFQASLGYSYFSNKFQGVNIGYGVWDRNKVGVLADIIYPIKYVDGKRVFLVSFFFVYDWSPISMLSIMPKVGYGPRVYEVRGANSKISWEPIVGLDIMFNINSFIRLYVSYGWTIFLDYYKNKTYLNGFSAGLRISY